MYGRTWMWNILPNFFEPVLYLTAIGIGVGAYINKIGGTSYIAFLAPGLVCVAAMNGASFEVTYNIYVRLTFEKAYDAMLTTPLEPEDVLMGEVLWAVTRATIYALSPVRNSPHPPHRLALRRHRGGIFPAYTDNRLFQLLLYSFPYPALSLL